MGNVTLQFFYWDTDIYDYTTTIVSNGKTTTIKNSATITVPKDSEISVIGIPKVAHPRDTFKKYTIDLNSKVRLDKFTFFVQRNGNELVTSGINANVAPTVVAFNYSNFAKNNLLVVYDQSQSYNPNTIPSYSDQIKLIALDGTTVLSSVIASVKYPCTVIYPQMFGNVIDYNVDPNHTMGTCNSAITTRVT